MDWNSCVDSATGVATLQCIPVVFKTLINAAIVFSGVVALFLLILGGIQFITSRGDPKAAESARSRITWAIIGLVIVLAAFLIVNFIGIITGATCATDFTNFGFNTCQ